MAWIQVINEDEAAGELHDYYSRVQEEGRTVGNIQKVMSLNPKAMEAVEIFQHSWREEGVLSHRHREMVAVVTSALNRCHY